MHGGVLLLRLPPHASGQAGGVVCKQRTNLTANVSVSGDAAGMVALVVKPGFVVQVAGSDFYPAHVCLVLRGVDCR